MYGNYNDQAELVPFIGGTVEKNVKLFKVEFIVKQNDNGSTSERLAFSFKRDSEKDKVSLFTYALFPIDTAYIKEKYPQEEVYNKALQEEINAFNERCKHIALQYDITLEELKEKTANANSFSDYATKYSTLLASKLDDRQLYIKFSLNNNNKPEAPKYGRFIEVMKPGAETTLSFSDKEMEYINKNKSKIATQPIQEVDTPIVEEDIEI